MCPRQWQCTLKSVICGTCFGCNINPKTLKRERERENVASSYQHGFTYFLLTTSVPYLSSKGFDLSSPNEVNSRRKHWRPSTKQLKVWILWLGAAGWVDMQYSRFMPSSLSRIFMLLQEFPANMIGSLSDSKQHGVNSSDPWTSNASRTKARMWSPLTGTHAWAKVSDVGYILYC